MRSMNTIRRKSLRAGWLLACFALAFAACDRSGQVDAAADGQAVDDVPEAIAAAPEADLDADTPLVTVNDDTIRQADVDRQISQMFAQAGQAMPPEQLQQIAQQMMPQIIDQMIVHKLLEQEVERSGVTVPEEQIQEVIEELTLNLQGEMTLAEALEQAGMDEAELRKNIGEGLRIQTMVEARAGKVPDPTAEDIAAFYHEHPQHFEQPERLGARHILFEVDRDAGDEAKAEQKAEAEKVLQQLLEGADFEALAKEHSACPSSEDGGSLPPFAQGEMVPEFDAATRALEVGEISPVIETDFGYHVIRLDDRMEASKVPLPEVAERIREHVKQEREQKSFSAVIAALREGASIEYHQAGLEKPAPPAGY